MSVSFGILVGFVAWFIVRYLLAGLYTVDQNERAVKTVLGRAQRLRDQTTLDDPIAQTLRPDERERYRYPQLRVIQPGGPYFKWPWERVHKVSIATRTLNMAFDPETPSANSGGTVLDAVTKDQLNTGLTGQIRYQVSERNLYAYLFGVKNPIAHVMGYFVSILRERIANFEAPHAERRRARESQPTDATLVSGISINDLRKNLRDLNDHMDRECRVVGGALRRDARRVAHHRDRSAAGRGVGAGGDQHRAQPRVVGDQPRARGGRPEDRAVETRRRDRDAQGAGRGRAARAAGRAAHGSQGQRSARAVGVPAQRAAGALRPGARRHSRGGAMMDILPVALITFGVMFIARADVRCSSSASSASTRSCRSARATSTCCSARSSARSTSPGLHILPLAPRACGVSRELARAAPRARHAPRSGVPAQPAGELGGRRADGDRHLVRDVHQRSGRVPVQEHRSARIAARQRQQRDGAMPEQHAAGGHARDPAHHEPGGARGGVREVAPVGLSRSARSTSARCTSATHDMIRQIEEKVVNRLRQVTSAIRQDGANQVSIITNTAERTAAIEFAKAAAMRPQIVGAALNTNQRGSRDRSGAVRGAREPEAARGRGARDARAARAAISWRSSLRRRRRLHGTKRRRLADEKCDNDHAMLDVVVIGAGPVGLACGIEARREGLRARIVEKGALVNSLVGYPAQMEFFSTPELIEIGGYPFPVKGYKPTREEAVEYYRGVTAREALDVRLYERVLEVRGLQGDFTVATDKGEHRARSMVVSTGFFDQPNLLNVPGEGLPKVTHYYREPYPYVRQKVAVIGARNSAAKAALDCYRHGAEVTLVVRSAGLSDKIKYWIRPDLENRIKEGSIRAFFSTAVEEILETSIRLRTPEGSIAIDNDWVVATDRLQAGLWIPGTARHQIRGRPPSDTDFRRGYVRDDAARGVYRGDGVRGLSNQPMVHRERAVPRQADHEAPVGRSLRAHSVRCRALEDRGVGPR